MNSNDKSLNLKDASISDLVQLAKDYEKELPQLAAPTQFKPPLGAYLDCALHDPAATPVMVEKLCADAVHYRYATVFINPYFVPLAKQALAGSGVHVGTIVAFPLGAFPTTIKVAEAKIYLAAGADEIDMVMNVGMLKAKDYAQVYADIRQVVEQVHGSGKRIKVILETVLLDRFEKIMGCLICKSAGADFVKTSTGFSKGGATVEDVQLMRQVVGPSDVMGVKAAGGIHTLEDAMTMIAAGADRLGTRLADQIIEAYRQTGE